MRSGLPRVLQGDVDGAMAGRVRRGVAWTAGTRFALQLLQVGATAVLARLLSPADYGLAALVAVVTGLAAILVDLGIPASVIQRRGLDERFLSTAFWMNAGVGLVLAGVVCASAVPIAEVFDEPQLVGLVLLSSLTFVLSLNAVHVAVLQRAFEFGRISRMSLVTTTSGLAVSIAAAAAGMGPVSLVLGPVAERLVSVIQVWAAVRWVPRVRPSRADARDIWTFGRGITGTNLLSYSVGSADRVIIGGVVTVSALGYYNRAGNLMQLPIQQTTRSLAGVFFPALSAMADDVPRMRSAWLRLLRASWIVGVPVAVGLALTAPVLVEVLYGEGWGPVVPLLVVLSAGIPFLLVNSTTSPVYQALGRTGLQFRLGLINAVVALAALAVGVRWGVQGVAVAWVVRTVLGLAVTLVPMLRLLDLRLAKVLGALWRTAIGGAATAAAVWGVVVATHDQPAWVALALQVAAGVVVYGAAAWLLERRTLRELLGRVARRKRVPAARPDDAPTTKEADA
ncbi:lipopolysaccharide biosynthesis protein [Actinotalea ferrariae]|uniref:lipopolysaccharide biosynthesis protein n=1 Tax=Actinotalea ferrariae TaxID=1386098 RepID=UPI001C8B3BE9|nr:lipopolysaccharide biosynthesis protein [Actinotalea ferrariae]MBX9244518.1 lipopolysaccharide biosynthesis protein [Actinotalea ferrariae]